MALREIRFASRNGRDTIHAWVYEPTVPARAIVQIVHGLGEHSRRYMRLIAQLLDAGFVVAADDHAGQGATAMAGGVWGDAGADADQVVVADELALAEQVRALHPDLPYVVFGHSWGSLIARGVAGEASDQLAGLILGGIAADMEGLETKLDRAALAAEPDQTAPTPDAYLGAMFDGFTERFGPDAVGTAWVARDAEVVRDHGLDPFNNFGAPLSVRFVRGFVDLYDRVNAIEWYPRVRAGLPVLILAGDQDPVTGYGLGAYRVANRLVASGHADVRTRVYPGFRHEVHNEPEIRDDVAQEIITFVDRIAEGSHA